MNDSSKNEWYQAEQYSDSIYNVIANAMADCKMQRNEFRKTVPKDGIIEFEATPDKVSYTPENWNASVLWNFLEEAIHGRLNTGVENKFSKKCIEAVGDRIAKYYKDIDGIEDLVNKAVSDIHEYAEALGLYEYVSELKKNWYYSNVSVSERLIEDDANEIEIKEALVKNKSGKAEISRIHVVYMSNDKIAYKINDSCIYVKLKPDMTIAGHINYGEDVYSYIDNTEERDTKYLGSRKCLTEILTAINSTRKLRQFIRTVAELNTGQQNDECPYICEAINNALTKRYSNQYARYVREIEQSLITNNKRGYGTYSDTQRHTVATWMKNKNIDIIMQNMLKTIECEVEEKNSKYNKDLKCPFKYRRWKASKNPGCNLPYTESYECNIIECYNDSEDLECQIQECIAKRYFWTEEIVARGRRYTLTSPRAIWIEKIPEVIIAKIRNSLLLPQTIRCNTIIELQEASDYFNNKRENSKIYNLKCLVSKETKTNAVIAEPEKESYSVFEKLDDKEIVIAIYE